MGEKHKYPAGAEALLRDFYMDDYLGGATTEEEATQLRSDLTEFLQLGGFHISQWCSSSKRVLHSIPVPDHTNTSLLTLSEDDITKALDLQWKPNTTQLDTQSCCIRCHLPSWLFSSRYPRSLILWDWYLQSSLKSPCTSYGKLTQTGMSLFQ
jgi:hypothetical protein